MGALTHSVDIRIRSGFISFFNPGGRCCTVLPSSSSTCSDNFLSIALTSSSAPACRCSLKFCQPLHPNSQRPPSCMFRKLLFHYINIWVWVNTYRYIFSGMNIHLPAILGFTRYQGFDPSPYVHAAAVFVVR